MTGSEHGHGGKLRELDREECLRLLRSGRVGRIAYADDTGPDVFPVNYVMDGEDVLIATTAYGSLARSSTNDRVAFEVDEIEESTESGWSVVVRGRAARLSPADRPAERPRAWAEGSRSFVLRITPETISGRRLIAS